MAGRRQSATAQARERARQAKAELDAERAERERCIEQLVTDFYLRDAEHREAIAAAEDAELRRARAVTAILDVEDATRTARLCGLHRADVIRLRRLAASDQDRRAANDDGQPWQRVDDAPPSAAAASY